MTVEGVPDVLAQRHLFCDESVAFYRQALEELQSAPGEHPLRARLYLGLGESLRWSGDAVGAREAFLDAARHARSVGAVDLLAEAAFGYGLGAGGLHRAARCDLQQIALLEEGLAALAPGDSALRVRLMARLAEELYFTPEESSRAALAAEAVAMATRLGDRRVLLSARYARELCRVGPDIPLSERIDSTAELIALAEEVDDAEASYLGHMLRELALMEAGRFADAAGELVAAEQRSDHLRIPGVQAWALSARARQAWLAGRFAQADELNAAAMTRALDQGGDPEMADLVIGGQLMAHQLLRSELAQFVSALEAYRELYPHLPVLRCFLAYAFADSGQLEHARQVLVEMDERHLFPMLRTTEWTTAMWALAGVVTLLDDVPRATLFYANLAPNSGRWFADWASTCLGPVDTALGMLATTMRSLDLACAHFEHAIVQASTASSPPWLAHAQVQFAVALRLRAADGDADRAAALEWDALRTCVAIGLDALAVRAAGHR